MKINVSSKTSKAINDNEINVIIEFSNQTDEIEKFIKYIEDYELNSNRKIIVSKNYELLEIKYDDIISFYSDKKNNYCRTKGGEYKIKSKLYEIEKMDINLIRISKSCIINIKHVEKFYVGETGKITVRLDDKTEEVVSRRKIKDVMSYLDERSIWLWKDYYFF